MGHRRVSITASKRTCKTPVLLEPNELHKSTVELSELFMYKSCTKVQTARVPITKETDSKTQIKDREKSTNLAEDEEEGRGQ